MSHRCYRQHHRGTCQSPTSSVGDDAAARRRSEKVSVLLSLCFSFVEKDFFTENQLWKKSKCQYTFLEACQRPFITNNVILKVMHFHADFHTLTFWTTFIILLFSGISRLLRKLGSCQFQQSSQQEQYEMHRYTCKLYGEKVLYVIK